MCFKFKADIPKPPPPLPAAPPPPPIENVKPLPEDDLVADTDINPQVRDAKSKKDKNPQSKGTGALRIDKAPTVNTGTAGAGAGGVNV